MPAVRNHVAPTDSASCRLRRAWVTASSATAVEHDDGSGEGGDGLQERAAELSGEILRRDEDLVGARCTGESERHGLADAHVHLCEDHTVVCGLDGVVAQQADRLLQVTS